MSNDERRGQSIVIAATFTADPIKAPMTFWLEKLEIPAAIAIAPYGQVLQALLSPESPITQNRGGFNVLLIRLEDWMRERPVADVEQNLEHLRNAAATLIAALASMRSISSATTLVFLCPLQSTLPVAYRAGLQELQSQLLEDLHALVGVHCWTHADLVQLYPILAIEDLRADRLGHIPYTRDYFVALATLMARRIATLLKPPYKVIALDCDNTLWKGICGEEGAAGVELTPARMRLHDRLIRLHDQGVLLCLCSKNNPADVAAVFEHRADLRLREQHVIASRVNWGPKSANLLSLAEQLQLSLDSFILIDDSPVECAEVRSRCPSVLTLQLPSREEDIEHFIDHVWAFDKARTTEEASQRTAQYLQNRERDCARRAAANLADFLASLDLRVEISRMQSQHLDRVAELIRRTNQFNLTTIRRTVGEIESLCNASAMCAVVVHVSDRFGDYGLVGAVLFRSEHGSLDVDTFVLSCRVLGRGVEHAIVRELARIARQADLDTINLRFRRSARNVPAWTFLERSFGEFRSAQSGNGAAMSEILFSLPVDVAERVSVYAAAGDSDSDGDGDGEGEQVVPSRDATIAVSDLANRWHDTAYRLSHVGDILAEFDRWLPRVERAGAQLVAPRNEVEEAIARIWREVLRLEHLGVHDDFFEIGGDSLLAVQVLSRIGSVLGVELSLDEFFRGSTVAEVSSQTPHASRFAAPIERAHELSAPLSFGQQRLWFISQLDNASAAYHIPLCLRMDGELDRAALQSALDALLRRHESLRTVFVDAEGEPVQQVLRAMPFDLQEVDLRARSREEREAEVAARARAQSAPFDLIAGPPIRGSLLHLAHDEHVLLFTMHHIVSDGWSIGVILRDLVNLYGTYFAGLPESLPPLPLRYTDFASWQRRDAAQARSQEHLLYWRDQLRGAPSLLELPLDRPRPAAQSYRGADATVSLDVELTAQLRTLSRRLDVTLAMALQVAWTILLSRLSGQRDLVIGVPVANRPRVELENLVGFFVNTLPVRVRLDDDPTVGALVLRVKDVMLAAYAHQAAPFERIVEALQPVRSLSHSPILQVLFAFQNARRETPQPRGLLMAEEEVPSSAAQFDLTLSLRERAGGISGFINYATDLFDRSTIERWVGHFATVLREMANGPDVPLSKLRLMSETERWQVLRSFNQTSTPYPDDRAVHNLFEEQAARSPDAVAVICGGRQQTYKEVNELANKLAHHLRAVGAQPGQYVPVVLPRSPELVTAQLAVLKAGCAYVPIDPELPLVRQRFMIEDCAAQVAIARSQRELALLPAGVKGVDLQNSADAIARYSSLNPPSQRDAMAPAYVMYTSGSTGTPKGVIVPHQAINRLVINSRYAEIGPHDVIAHCSNPAFDAATFEIWGGLLNGARVVVVPQEIVLDSRRLAQLLMERGTTILFLTVGLFNQCADDLACAFERLRYLLVGGDVLDPRVIERVLERSPPQRLLNAYGPTESTTFATTYRIERVSESARSIPIGSPIANTQIYVLDEHCEPVPIGVTGEIYIGGAGVAQGYLNRPELTAERFVNHPFAPNPPSRLYRTGDLGRWQADGMVEFLGRNDGQVKVRGFRIELGEVEAQLTRHPHVKEVAVVTRADRSGGKLLVAYISCAGDLPSPEVLRAHVRSALPEYMVPSAFVTLPNLPLTPNGKLDRRALPEPDADAYASREYEPPGDEVEESLATIWRELLRTGLVGRHDNFFELGGHSLLAMQVAARIRSALSIEMQMPALFQFPVLAELAAHVRELQQTYLLDRLERGDMDALVEEVASLPETSVAQLLQQMERSTARD
jgi:amino acid adenylation domain-containing protein/FkbH-like protein